MMSVKGGSGAAGRPAPPASAHVALFWGKEFPPRPAGRASTASSFPRVHSFIEELSGPHPRMHHEPDIVACHLAHGLEIDKWANGTEETPTLDYIDSTPVALVLTHVIQLAAFLCTYGC